MKLLARLAAILILCVAGSGANAAESLQLDGQFVQGGLVFGMAPAGTEVTLDDRQVRVAPDGRFVFGFGRDAAPKATLKVTYPGGRVEARSLTVAARDYRIERVDGLPPKKVNPPEEVWNRIKRENAEIAKVRAVDRPEALFASGWQWPATGRISGVYGSQRVLNGEPKRPHFGVDVAAPVGTPIVAPADGIVVLAEPDLYYTGGTIILDHGHGLTSAFLHMEEVQVAVGDQVARGGRLGTLGGTGRATGPHLDWRINWFDVRVDPELLVPPMPTASTN